MKGIKCRETQSLREGVNDAKTRRRGSKTLRWGRGLVPSLATWHGTWDDITTPHRLQGTTISHDDATWSKFKDYKMEAHYDAHLWLDNIQVQHEIFKILKSETLY